MLNEIVFKHIKARAPNTEILQVLHPFRYFFVEQYEEHTLVALSVLEELKLKTDEDFKWFADTLVNYLFFPPCELFEDQLYN